MLIFDPHHDLNTSSFYSNPTESAAIDKAYFITSGKSPTESGHPTLVTQVDLILQN